MQLPPTHGGQLAHQILDWPPQGFEPRRILEDQPYVEYLPPYLPELPCPSTLEA